MYFNIIKYIMNIKKYWINRGRQYSIASFIVNWSWACDESRPYHYIIIIIIIIIIIMRN